MSINLKLVQSKLSLNFLSPLLTPYHNHHFYLKFKIKKEYYDIGVHNLLLSVYQKTYIKKNTVDNNCKYLHKKKII